MKAVRENGVVLQVGSQQRSSREFRTACELVRNGRLGELERVEVWLPPDSGEILIDPDTIAAIATAPGRGGIGIIRISGPDAARIGNAITGGELLPRRAHVSNFLSDTGATLDSGIALLFPGPHSFTGETVVELQAHGGPVILDLLLRQVCRLGARQAAPGEFSQRAYLNDKIDLAQAEAIADLINSTTEQAALNATRSLQGEFSRRIDELVGQVTQLRVYVEAVIDFPEEEIDFLADARLSVFGELRYALSDSLRLVGGGRFSNDRRRGSGFQPTIIVEPAVEEDPVALFTGEPPPSWSNSESWDNLDWKLGVEFDAAADTLVYATAQTGFQPGTFDVFPDSVTEASELLSFTVGARSRLAGDPADIIMAPRLRDVGLLEFGKAAEAMKTGRECVEKVLPDIKRLVESLQD